MYVGFFRSLQIINSVIILMFLFLCFEIQDPDITIAKHFHISK